MAREEKAGFWWSVPGMLLLALVTPIVFVALATVGYFALEDLSWYHSGVDAAARLGRYILAGAVAVLVLDLTALVVLAAARGESDGTKSKVVVEKRLFGTLSSFAPGRTVFKSLGGRQSYVSARSLADGTATLADRMVVAGSALFLVAFFLVFLGAGLVFMKDLLVLGLLPILPGVFVFRILRAGWRDYRAARATRPPTEPRR